MREVRNETWRLGDRMHVVVRQRVRGSVRAITAIQNTLVFLKESKVVADIALQVMYAMEYNQTYSIPISYAFCMIILPVLH